MGYINALHDNNNGNNNDDLAITIARLFLRNRQAKKGKIAKKKNNFHLQTTTSLLYSCSSYCNFPRKFCLFLEKNSNGKCFNVINIYKSYAMIYFLIYKSTAWKESNHVTI